MADTNEELEICHSLENVNCSNETPNQPDESTEPKPTNDEPIVSPKPSEPITTNETIVPTTSME